MGGNEWSEDKIGLGKPTGYVRKWGSVDDSGTRAV